MFSLSFTIQLSYFWAVGGLPAEESKRGDSVVSVVFSYVKWKHYFFKICFHQKYEKSNATDGTYSHCLGPPLLVLPPLRSWHSLPLLCSGLSWANPENWCATVSLHSYLTLFCIFIHELYLLIFYFDLIKLQFWVTLAGAVTPNTPVWFCSAKDRLVIYTRLPVYYVHLV